ncbi:YceI family protein [Flavobacterium muglaense]|uniref:YceI family protein n=1 Tax=Flavobacterium muglaense TaxID=2764716 RepID=A0A923MY02_9FLAO|nr:YceI family protein [Flavobacterium muglaense]MBC5837317.1 YceI family protein [Flavobacterium muglaense]MBC5843759.1 YceI family protein [Flavobacterium muglaense]
MKKTIIIFALLLIGTTVFSQKMITRNGKITFEASIPSFEEIKATNSTVSCILDEATGDFAALVLIKSFKFKAPLMEEHFNENYMESNLFPKATFKGKILNFDAKKLSTASTTYELEGDLTIHGITKKIKTKINLILTGGKLNTTANFDIKPQDYGIEIPSLVKDKIAKNIDTRINFNLETQ